MSVPYAELFRIAEEAHKTGSEEYIRELCEDAANEYGDDAKRVYRATERLYNQNFA